MNNNTELQVSIPKDIIDVLVHQQVLNVQKHIYNFLDEACSYFARKRPPNGFI